MLEVLGSGYVIEHCIAALDDLRKKTTFEVYVTDCLKAISENSAGGQNRGYMKTRYVELIRDDFKPKKEHTAEEVKENILSKLKAMTEGGEDS